MAGTPRRSKRRLYCKNFYIAKTVVLAMFPLVLLVLPMTAFDNGFDTCLFTLLSGYHCPGCGMTRACMHMIHFDFKGAWVYNKVSFIVLPILCGLLIEEFRKTITTIGKYDEIVASIHEESSKEPDTTEAI